MLEHFLHILLLLAVWSAPLPFSAWLAGRGRDGRRPFGHDWLVLIGFWTACQISVPLLLGAFGWLGARGVYVLEATLLCVGLALQRIRPGRELVLLPPRTPGSCEAAFAFAGLVVGGLGLWSLLRTPTSNYDSFAYHLPAMIWWAQHGSFEFLPDLMHAAYYAFDWELASLLSVYPLRSDLFIAVPNLFAWAMWGLSIYLLARRLGASIGAAAAPALMTLTMLTVLARLDAAQPDLALAAFFVTAIYFGVSALEDDSPSMWAFALFAILLLPGLKMSGLVYAPMALVAMFALAWASTGRRPRPRWRPALQLPLWIWALLLGGFWYGRNLGLNGNPFGFLSIDFFGQELFRGDQTREELARTTLLAVFDPRDGAHWETLLRIGWDKLGPGFVAMAVAALLSLAHARRRLVLTLLALGAWALFAYWSAPYSGDNGSRDFQFTGWFAVGLRYGYPMFSLLAVGAALGLTRWRIGLRAGLVLALGCLLYTLVFELKSPGLPMRWSVGFALVACSWLLLRERWPQRWIPVALVVITLGLSSWQSRVLDQQRDTQRQKQYGFLHGFMEANVGADQVVGYARTHRRYQLFGKHLQREVICVDPEQESPQQWLQRMRELDIDVLAVGTADNAEIARAGLPDVRTWIAQMPEHFELLFPAQSELKDLELYRLR